ncbi:MAG: M13 family metallopeptidase [Bacteroidetes bacterium]|nr:M13 family metallopeptidase [Bacteroidota bacterium]
MQKSKYLFLIALLILIISCEGTKECNPINLSNMDKSVSPGDDFFRYVNGNWLKNNPIPEEYSRYGAFEEVEQLNDDRLKSLLQKIENDKSAEHGSNRQKVRDLYHSGMDIEILNQQGIEPLKPLIEKVWQAESSECLVKIIAELHNKGFRPFFGLSSTQDRKNTEMMIASISQAGLGMSDRDYYLNDDNRTLSIKNAYKQMMIDLFRLAEYDDEAIYKKVDDIMRIETFLAEASMTRLERRNPYATYNKMSVSELKKASPGFNWDIYFAERNINIDDLNVAMPDFISKYSELFKKEKLDAIKNYLEWNIIRNSASYIGDSFENATFEFYGKVMSGSQKLQDRWKRVLSTINSSIGEALGQEYVAEFFPAEAKTRMEELVEYLREAFMLRIGQLDWMSDETKQKAHTKLSSMNVKIGYPDNWTDYSELEINNQAYVLNVIAAREFNIRRNLAEIGKPVDRSKWFMNAQTVNAYYSSSMNEIVFPAAILQPPFFYMKGDDAVNFGAIGMVIGHEMTHGFDDQGRNYDADGTLRDWWTAEDANRFKEKAEVLVEQYNNYIMLDTLTINGRLSLGENIADLGGLSIAYTALQLKMERSENPGLIDGFTPEQRFFISYAQVWRNNIREQQLMKQLQEGPHSPGEARVNGVVYNMDSFYKHFNVSEDAARFIPKEHRARIW